MDALRKKLKLEAMRRGYLELELVLRPFARAEIADMPAAELEQLALLLALEDLDLWDVICGRQPLPDGVEPTLIAKIRRYFPGAKLNEERNNS